ncbi:hypothetical protein [Actinomadura rugatobispora]|uniref:Uncharacterized protein n=1 Tax=Actinomadura rugatobispora TaxID=1994 RepID=A0ABW0ZTN4_9ACTN|nr:hypothetical protein GCM10010200_035740 [Actinomadura rugatobispora]
MIKLRHVTVAVCALCWSGSIAGLLFEEPSGETHSFLLAAAVGLLVVLRTEHGPRIRRVARAAYWQGTQDTLQRFGEAEPRPSKISHLPERGGLHPAPLPSRRFRGGAAAVTVLLAVSGVLVVMSATLADSLERATPTETAPAPDQSIITSTRVIAVTPSAPASAEPPRTTTATSASPAADSQGQSTPAPKGAPPAPKPWRTRATREAELDVRPVEEADIPTPSESQVPAPVQTPTVADTPAPDLPGPVQ